MVAERSLIHNIKQENVRHPILCNAIMENIVESSGVR